MRILKLLIFLLVHLLLVFQQVNARVNLPAFFSDHMVLQQNSIVAIWGWGDTNSELKIVASWDNTAIATRVNNNSAWHAELKTPAAGGPFSIMIQGVSDTLILEDVLIGEVWLASGQSNMERNARLINLSKEEIADSDYPSIRLFQTLKRTARSSQIDMEGEWTECNSSTMVDFSSVAFYFAKALHQNLDVPVGIIHSSWGATGAEAWLNPSVISNDNELQELAGKIPANAYASNEIGSAYNAMIAPLIPFQIAGVIWYQGESNRYNYSIYNRLFTSLIQNWRGEWNYNFPFYYVQIAPYNYDKPLIGLKIREAQLNAMTVSNTGMVVISDIGDVNSMHPENKKDVGKRLANWALAKTYNIDRIAYSGPVYKQMKIEGKKIHISFDHSEGGLVSRGGELTHFQIAGEDKLFINAKAKIAGNTILVYANEIKKPIAVRFAWSNTAEPNLFNKEGLPASCFRTDKWVLK